MTAGVRTGDEQIDCFRPGEGRGGAPSLGPQQPAVLGLVGVRREA